MDAAKAEPQPQFISWRWRVLTPVFGVALVATMVGVYATTGAPAPTAAATAMSAEVRLQFMRLLMASLASGVVIVAFVAVGLMLNQVNRVRRVAEALAAGQKDARTGMKPTDEIGALGAALDRYAERVQAKHDVLRTSLRRQRREVAHLTSVLEALPDGIVVQDLEGRVLLMNDIARKLLQAQEGASDARLSELTAVATDSIGPALAPGLYLLGDPQRIERGGRMLSAQAAAVLSVVSKRVGTVIVLRDVTDEVRRERARDVLIGRLADDVYAPLAGAGRESGSQKAGLNGFAREMTRHAVALQKLIVEMRELTADFDRRGFNREQRALSLDALVEAVANEWRPIAQAAELTLKVRIDQPGLLVLGDERRLRWAIGNLIDNAIKYTPAGGKVALEVRAERGGMARLRVRDNGAGIAPDELTHVFVRFYRGNPVADDGQMIHIPGAGQGLTLAREIVEAHGGTIRIKSKLGVGTSVAFALPLTASVSLPALPRLDADAADEDETAPAPRFDAADTSRRPSSNGAHRDGASAGG